MYGAPGTRTRRATGRLSAGHDRSGKSRDRRVKLVRIRNAGFETVSNISESGASMFGYDSKTTPDVLNAFRTDGIERYRSFVRIDDGRWLRIQGECRPVGSDREILVMLCATKTLVGNRYLQYIAAYRWPNGSTPRP
jgi:hypothetical protein